MVTIDRNRVGTARFIGRELMARSRDEGSGCFESEVGWKTSCRRVDEAWNYERRGYCVLFNIIHSRQISFLSFQIKNLCNPSSSCDLLPLINQ